MTITDTQLARLKRLIADGAEHRFYSWRVWLKCREQVLAYDRHECQLCKAKGKYRAAALVHHVKHLTDRPDLALSLFDPATGERQLVSVCKACHEAQHPEALVPYKPVKPPLTLERWD